MLPVSPKETGQRAFNPHTHAEMDKRAAILQPIVKDYLPELRASIACLRRPTQSNIPRDRNRKHTGKRRKSQKHRQFPDKATTPATTCSKKRRRDIESDIANLAAGASAGVNSPKCHAKRNSAENVLQVPCPLKFAFDNLGNYSLFDQAISQKGADPTTAVDVNTCESFKRPPALRINDISFGTPRDTFDLKTPKMSRIRFSSDTKMHDGLCKTSLNVEAIFKSYYDGELNSVKDLESFCTKMDCHNHLPSVVESISTLLVKLKNAGPGDKIPLLRRGGGKTYKMTCAHIESVTYLYNMLLKLV